LPSIKRRLKACPGHDLIERSKHDGVARVLDDDLAAIDEPVPPAEVGRQPHSTIWHHLGFMRLLQIMPSPACLCRKRAEAAERTGAAILPPWKPSTA